MNEITTREVAGTVIGFTDIHHWHAGQYYVIDVAVDGEPAGFLFDEPRTYYDYDKGRYVTPKPSSWTPRFGGDNVFGTWTTITFGGDDVDEVADNVAEYFEERPGKLGLLKASVAKLPEGDPVPAPVSV